MYFILFFFKHLSKSGKPLKGQKLSEARLDDLLQDIRNDDKIPTRKATDKITNSQMMRDYLNEAGEDVMSTGSVVGNKPFVINADDGAKVDIYTNGNGKNQAIMEEVLNRRRR